MKWEDFSVDAAHPSVDGHKLISEFIEYMYKTAEAAPEQAYELPEEAVYSTHYINASMATLTMPNENIAVTDNGGFAETATKGNGFPGYWEYHPRTAESTDHIKLTAKGSAFFLIYRTNNTKAMGEVNVYINGELVKTINSHEEFGWGGAAAMVVAEYDEVQDMEIEIRPADDETGRKMFTVFGFAVSQN